MAKKDTCLAVLAGEKEHKPDRKQEVRQPAQRVSLLVDIEAKLRSGKGAGYARWVSKFNLKQTAQTLAYLNQHQLLPLVAFGDHLFDQGRLARAEEAGENINFCHKKHLLYKNL